ncbi:MAG TPA: RHS repeat-associated core domain-containing protein [Flavobacteriales bacterium]|nr:RHS repeat-associated core domain-containing protein [Flavobacteriales bacterium]
METSADAQNWHTDARYFYYPHGPLQRVELGEHLVQGTDYAYTLQGWLKGINGDRLNPTTDMGRDGDATVADNPNLLTGRDAYALSLGYYGDADYKAITSSWDDNSPANVVQRPFAPMGTSGTLNTEHTPLYNGNIAHTVNTLQHFGLWDATNGDQGQVMAMVYRYDQLNRLRKARGVIGLASTNTWHGVADSGPNEDNRYRSEYTYDANGNIETVRRYDGAGTGHYDSFAYHHHTSSGRKQQNRLYELIDAATMNTGSDIVTTATGFDNTPNGVNANNNYGYDALGNLVRDEREDIELIHWTVAGKVDSIQRPGTSSRSPLKFRYGASGQRVSKQVGDFYATEPGAYREHYIRDAQGNIMATYRYTNTGAASLKLNERPLYGSSRLGSLRTGVELHTLSAFDPANANPVQMVDLNYELTDHLGNVCAVVTGRLLDGNGGGTAKQAELVSAQGYEPFGALLPGRNYSSGSYRFGYAGAEKDDEVHGSTGTSYDFGARLYDPRVGKWLSLDPLAMKYPYLSPYAYTADNPILFVDFDGKDFFIKSKADQRRFLAVIRKTFGDENGNLFTFDKNGKLQPIDIDHMTNLTCDQRYVVEQFNAKLVTDADVTVNLKYTSSGISEVPLKSIKRLGKTLQADIRINTEQANINAKLFDTDDNTMCQGDPNYVPSDEEVDAIDTWHEIGHILVERSKKTGGPMGGTKNNRMTVGFENVVRSIFGLKPREGNTHAEPRPDGSYPRDKLGSDAPPDYPDPNCTD